MSHVLIVDDEESICWALAKLVRSLGHRSTTAASAEEAFAISEADSADLVLLDVRLPGMDGLAAIDRLQISCPHARIVVMTAFGDLDTAVKAVRAGAFEYVVKPFAAEHIRQVISRGIEATDCERAFPPREPRSSTAKHLVGDTPEMRELFKQIALAAASDANIFIQGESGTGKELAARAIHENSRSSAAPFVAINAAALSPSLAESELFGHVAGSFTGADRTRRGLLAAANGGTLFLDEVAEIPISIQVKLLRVLEQHEVLPVGGETSVCTNFRVITATHQDLREMVRRGEFREDLFYRLWSYQIRMPSLSERRDDIESLALHFLGETGQGRLGLSREAVESLRQRPWPGNVRELRNVIEHASVQARGGIIYPEHLPSVSTQAEVTAGQGSGDQRQFTSAARQRAKSLLADADHYGRIYKSLIGELEESVFDEALRQHHGEIAPAARALGIHRTTLAKRVHFHREPSQ